MYLRASASSIERGQSVTLSWKTENARSISINQGIGSVTPVAEGSRTVSPNGDTTYVATVVDVSGNTSNCAVSVTVGEQPPPPPPGEAPKCVYLRANDTSIKRGDAVTLSWKTENATSITINQGIGEVKPTAEGSIEVSPNGNTTYVATVKNAQRTVNCEVSVKVEEDERGGGGGKRSPRVSLDDLPDDLPFSFVYLDEMPYTGLELGPMGIVLYWIALIGISGALTYFIVFNAMPLVFRRLSGADDEVNTILASGVSLVGDAHGAHDTHGAHEVHAAAHSAAHTGPAAVAKSYSSYEGFRSFAQGGALTIDDIVTGLAREAHAPVEAAPVAPAAALPAHVEVAAPAASFDASHGTVPAFIGALLAGNRDGAFEVIRQVTRAGDSAEDFITHVVVALDDAYRAKLDGTPVHADIAALTASAAPAFLEKVIGALTAAVDGTYSMGVTGVKLAVTRALGVVNG